MSLLMKGLMDKQTTSIEDEQAIKIQKINIDREILRIKNIEYENYKNFKTRQMFLIALTTTLFSAFAVSIGLLGWLVKVEYSQLAWLIAFSTGVLVSMVGASFYIRKEMKNRDETIRKIKEAYDSIKTWSLSMTNNAELTPVIVERASEQLRQERETFDQENLMIICGSSAVSHGFYVSYFVNSGYGCICIYIV